MFPSSSQFIPQKIVGPLPARGRKPEVYRRLSVRNGARGSTMLHIFLPLSVVLDIVRQ
jgi:hypothetical protein